MHTLNWKWHLTMRKLMGDCAIVAHLSKWFKTCENTFRCVSLESLRNPSTRFYPFTLHPLSQSFLFFFLYCILLIVADKYWIEWIKYFAMIQSLPPYKMRFISTNKKSICANILYKYTIITTKPKNPIYNTLENNVIMFTMF